MQTPAKNGSGKYHTPEGKLIRNIFSDCDSCGKVIELEDLVQIAELHSDLEVDQLIVFQCFACEETAKGTKGHITQVQALIDEQVEAFKNGVEPRDWRDL